MTNFVYLFCTGQGLHESSTWLQTEISVRLNRIALENIGTVQVPREGSGSPEPEPERGSIVRRNPLISVPNFCGSQLNDGSAAWRNLKKYSYSFWSFCSE